MQTVLFHETIFGPIHSRRLGTSLGINLSPTDGKICSFDCVYCEAGYNAQGQGTSGVPSRKQVKTRLTRKLEALAAAGERLDVITFSGNGEPTLHPEFAEIVADTMRLRDRFAPDAKVCVLTNATFLGNPKVTAALASVDCPILKLDSANGLSFYHINRPVNRNVTVYSTIGALARFPKGKAIIQTMLLCGEHDGKPIDNTTEAEIEALIEAYKEINPLEVQLYSIDRTTPEEKLTKVERAELEAIAQRVKAAGINVNVF